MTNSLHILIESQRALVAHQKSVRFWGIILAVALHVVLFFVIAHLTDALAKPFHIFKLTGIPEGRVNFPTCVFLIGGVFIIYTAVKEIGQMFTIKHPSGERANKPGKSAMQVVMMIVLMNLIFSFDSVLSALAIKDVFVVLATAITLSGLTILWLADGVTQFLKKTLCMKCLACSVY